MVSLKTESYVLRRNLQGRKSTYGTRYQNQTVRQTDRYTDRQTDGFSIKQTNKQRMTRHQGLLPTYHF